MDFRDSFLDHLRIERNYSEHTVTSYRIDLEKFEECFQNVDSSLSFVSVDADVVRLWMARLMDDGYTSTSVNRKLSTLRSFYKYLMIKGVMNENPLSGVHGPKNKKCLPSFLREREMTRLLDDIPWNDTFEDVRDRAMLELFYETGIRRSELVGLNDADVDFEAMQIKVTGKRNKQRLIPFGPTLKETLLNYLCVRQRTFPGGGREKCRVFLSGKGAGVTDAQVYAIVRKHLSKVTTLKKRSPHVLRHTFATALLNHSAELGSVKELLGHTGLAATEIYTHTTFEELKRIYKLAHPRA